MQVRQHRTKRRAGRIAAIVAAAFAAFFVLQMSSALGAPETQVWSGQANGATPDIEVTNLLYFLPDGTQGPGGASGTINLTLGGSPVVAYCIETTKFLNQTPSGTTSDVTEVPLATPQDRAVLWILQNETPTGAPTPAKQTQASTSQIAIWVLRGELRATDPTNSASVNAAVAALVQTALTESAMPRTLGLSIAAPAAGATSATVVVTGKPGAVVDLAIASGPGNLAAPSVTIGADGTASVALTAPGPGQTVVSATTASDGTLYMINPLDESQNTTTAANGTLAASASVNFTAATPTTPTTPTVVPLAPVTPAGKVTAKAKLRITKVGPRRAKVLRKVKYTIVVRNTSKTTAKHVTLRDVLPKGLSLAKSSRRGKLSGGRVNFSLGTLAPGKARRVNVWLIANASVRGKRTNVATARATGVAAVTARAATIFSPIVKRVQPAVTG